MDTDKRNIEIYDSTLRDGCQAEGISFSLQDKLNIVKALDSFGVAYIEAGNPGSNPKDMAFFRELQSVELKTAKLCAFGSTIKFGEKPQEDINLQSLLEARTETAAIVGKTWDLQVEKILGITLRENLLIVEQTLQYLAEAGKEIIFDAEQFFDGYKSNPAYALEVLHTAVKSGAGTLCLCDTNGGSLPREVESIVSAVRKQFPDVKIGIHCHDDIGCAVANSIAAADSGAVQIQGTFVGFGERCGNCDLSTLIPNLELKCGYDCHAKLEKLTHTARKIAEIANTRIRNNHPYIGKSAFAHKGGMHIDAVQKLASSFEHISPSTVGNRRKFLLSEMSGRGTVLPRIQKYAPELTKQSPETEQITEALKERELLGYQYEGADASFELMVKKELGLYKPHFRVIMYKTLDDFPSPDGELQSNAMIKIEVGGKTEFTCASGNGPINALDIAMRQALTVFYPELSSMRLTDFKVRVLESGAATDSVVRVLIESGDGNESFTTIGVSNDIIEAGFTALVDSFEYKLGMTGKE